MKKSCHVESCLRLTLALTVLMWSIWDDSFCLKPPIPGWGYYWQLVWLYRFFSFWTFLFFFADHYLTSTGTASLRSTPRRPRRWCETPPRSCSPVSPTSCTTSSPPWTPTCCRFVARTLIWVFGQVVSGFEPDSLLTRTILFDHLDLVQLRNFMLKIKPSD